MKETYGTLKHMLSSIEYSKHSWHICADLKAIAVLVGLQAGYTTFCCFLCQWDSRDSKKHYIKKGRGGLMIRSQLWGPRVPGSKPDSTEDPSYPYVAPLHSKSYVAAQMPSRWCNVEASRRAASSGVVLVI
ncbi:hypothetical protein AVEN_145457-1 [Araneus ventricosus]|uniref:Uncharacterized protein n=1 Tax=Araneus ventricosus TaxID=182803 RepID=A0A4Y2VIT2_ARAVE|nr:hypothetical protein AVEN_145457-1 [Araneus ventricosus]